MQRRLQLPRKRQLEPPSPQASDRSGNSSGGSSRCSSGILSIKSLNWVNGDVEGLAIGRRSTETLLEHSRVGSIELASEHDVLSQLGLRLWRQACNRNAGAKVGCRSTSCETISLRDGSFKGRVRSNQGLNRLTDGLVRSKCLGRVDDSEHSLLAMGGDTAEEEGGVSSSDLLVKNERRVLPAGSEGSIEGSIADSQIRRLGDRVRASTPDEADSVAN